MTIQRPQALRETIKVIIDNKETTMDLEEVVSISPDELQFVADISFIAFALINNCFVTKVSLRNNSLNDNLCEPLAVALMSNRSVTRLDLSNNNIGNDGAKYLGEMLKVNCSIAYFNISYNSITEDGHHYFADALTTNRTLVDLCVMGRPWHLITLRKKNKDKERVSYVEALKANHSLTGLKIAPKDTSSSLDAQLQEPLTVNRTLRDLCHRAAQQNDMTELKKHLGMGVSLLSGTGEEDNTLLHWAVLGNHKEVVEFLIRQFQAKEITIAIENRQGKTPLKLARECQHIEIIRLLSDAEDWFVSFNTQASLMNSAQSFQTVEQPVAKQIQSDRKQQWEAALSAVKEKREKYRALDKERLRLLQKLAEPAPNETEHGKTEDDYKKILRELEEANQAFLDAKENERQLASELEVSRSEAREYKTKLEKLSQEKKKLEEKLTEIVREEKSLKMQMEVSIGAPLFAAVTNKDKTLLEEALNKGYDVNKYTDQNGMTLLHRAAKTKSGEIIKLLLERGALPNTNDNNLDTSFHIAIKTLDFNSIQLLIDFGADVNELMGNNRIAPIEFAVKKCNQVLIKLLVEAGANVNIRRNNKILTDSYKEIVDGLKKKIRDKEKEYGSGVLMGQAEEEVDSIRKELAPYEETYKLLVDAAKSKDPNIAYFRAKRLIENRLGVLASRYDTAIDIQLKRPDILEELGIQSIVQSNLKNLNIDCEEIKNIIDPNMPNPIPLHEIDRKGFQEKIEEFFKDWETRLKKADDNSKNKPHTTMLPSSYPSSLASSPSSMISRPSSSMES